MKLKTLFVGIILAIFLFSASASFAQQGDQAEMMKKWQEYMTPGIVHQSFAKMAGNWTAVITNYMNGQEMKSDGTASYEMILGGRYLKSTFKSSIMGMPMEGFGLDGYDNATQEYLSVWMDNFGTGIMYLKGKLDEATKSVIYNGTSVDPMTGKNLPVKTIAKNIDDDHSIMEMYMITDGKEVKSMHVEYTRSK